MKYLLNSIATTSFWRYALFSRAGLAKILTITGGIYLFIEMLDFFNMYSRDKHSAYSFFVVITIAVIITVFSRRPVSKILYQIPKKDFCFEVLIGDLLDMPASNVVISTNTTFDTDVANGLIHPDSLQGKFTAKYFLGNIGDLDRQVSESLKETPFQKSTNPRGKQYRYAAGTVAKVKVDRKTFYLSAMAELNAEGTASTTSKMIDESLEALWQYIATRGEHGDIAIGLIGTGRGRVNLSRKKIVEKIAQSFADASQGKVFSNKLTIVIFPGDAERFNVNLFEIRDYLTQSLHV